MRESERKSKGLSKQATGKSRAPSGGPRVRWVSGAQRPDQPVDSSVTPDQPFDLSVYVQQPDAPHTPEPRVNWT
jgi:hypothetical protein